MRRTEKKTLKSYIRKKLLLYSLITVGILSQSNMISQPLINPNFNEVNKYSKKSFITEAVEKKWEGDFNAVSPNPVTQTKLISALTKAMKRPFVFPPIPKFFIKLIVGEMSHLILDSHWVSSKKVQNKGFKFDYPNINKALESIFK